MPRPTIEHLRSIQWANTFNWNVQFQPGLPAPFQDWTPAHSLTEPRATLESYQIPGFLSSSYKVPKSFIAADSLNLSFYDDENGTIENWFTTWINIDILNQGQYISTVEKSARILLLERLDSLGVPISNSLRTYRVYPEGKIGYNGNSNSEAVSLDVELVIVGKDHGTSKANGGTAF